MPPPMIRRAQVEVPDVMKQKFVERKISEKIPISLTELVKLCKEADLNRGGGHAVEKLFQDLCDYAIRYVVDIWRLDMAVKAGYSVDDRNRDNVEEMDRNRSILHTSVTDQVRILLRNLNNNGVNTDWAKDLFDVTGDVSRAASGKFAIEIASSICDMSISNYSPAKEDDVVGGHL